MTFHPRRLPCLAALFSLALPACAGLSDIYRITSPLTDTETNVEVGVEAFPAPVCERLALPPEVEAWLGRDEPASAWPFQRVTRAKKGALTIVNTDVDDTVIASLWDRGRYARGQRYPGALELLEAEGQALVVLTARPSLAESSVREGFCGWFHDSRPACADIGVSPGELGNLIDSLGMGLVKAEALLRQREDHPEALTVFNGDSGQGDWIAALIVRDIDPAHIPYAALHDVRAWSPEHRIELRNELLESDRLAGIYRRVYPAERLEGHLQKIRADIMAALGGPGGRLDGAFLRKKNIFLHRSYAALALDLAEAGLIAEDSADHVLRRAARELCFAPENELGFDRKADRERLVARLRARAAQRPLAATTRVGLAAGDIREE